MCGGDVECQTQGNWGSLSYDGFASRTNTLQSGPLCHRGWSCLLSQQVLTGSQAGHPLFGELTLVTDGHSVPGAVLGTGATGVSNTGPGCPELRVTKAVSNLCTLLQGAEGIHSPLPEALAGFANSLPTSPWCEANLHHAQLSREP